MPIAKPCLDAALAYLARGWSVIPLCPFDHIGVSGEHQQKCARPGKTPMMPWKLYQTELPKEQALRLVWDRHPSANVGIVMGPVSGLFGIDVDGPDGSEAGPDAAL